MAQEHEIDTEKMFSSEEKSLLLERLFEGSSWTQLRESLGMMESSVNSLEKPLNEQPKVELLLES